MNAGCDERSIFGVHPLKDETTPIASPRRLHLGEDPLVCPKAAGVVEVDGMVQADHHADLGRRLGVLCDVLAVLYSTNALYVCVVDEILSLELSIVHLQQLLQHILVDARLGVVLALGRVAP